MDLDPVIDDLRLLVECESPSSDAAALRQCGEVLADLLERRLGAPGEVGDDGRVRWRSGGDARPVLLLGHLDTVWEAGTLERMPFDLSNGKITGPGVFDMKSGLVCTIHALAALRAEDRLPPVELLVTSDEETGSLRSRDAIEDAARRCRRVLVMEPCGPGGAIKTARKGAAFGRIEATGRAAHAGLDPGSGVNAIVGLGAVLGEVAALGDPATGTTLVPSLIRGGSTLNTVPAHAEAEVDIRFLSAAEIDRVTEGLAGLRAPGGVELRTEVTVNRPPLTEASSAPLLPALQAAAAEVGQELDTVTVGGASDGNLAAAAGAAVVDGLGPEGDGAHADHEHVTVLGIERRLALLPRLIGHVSPVEVP